MKRKLERSPFLLMESTLKIKKEIYTFLKEYQRFLRSLGRQERLQGALAPSFSRLLFTLRIIQQTQFQKNRMIRLLAARDMQQSAALKRFFEEEQRVERQISSTLREIQKYLSGDIPTPSPPWLLSQVLIKNS